MEQISWNDRVRNEVLRRDKGAKNILHTIKEGRLTGSVISSVRNAFSNTLLKKM